MRKLLIVSGGVVVAAAILAATAYLYATRLHDPDNPRSRPYGYLMAYSVEVDRLPDDVFAFITTRLPDVYRSLAAAHDRFDVIGGDSLLPGVVMEVEEYQENEGVRHRYVVVDAIPGQLLHFASTPSQIMERRGETWVQTGRCNALVWFDIAPHGTGSRITQTILIEMPDLFTKLLIDMAILAADGNEWQEHLVEELDALAVAIQTAG